jgi:hypothetical protein
VSSNVAFVIAGLNAKQASWKGSLTAPWAQYSSTRSDRTSGATITADRGGLRGPEFAAGAAKLEEVAYILRWIFESRPIETAVKTGQLGRVAARVDITVLHVASWAVEELTGLPC